MHIPYGGFTLIQELMSSIWKIGKILKYRYLICFHKFLIRRIFLNVLLNDIIVIVVEPKWPDIILVVVSLLQYRNDLSIKSFLFQHPKNIIGSKDFTIENVLFLNELQNLFMTSWSQDVIEAL